MARTAEAMAASCWRARSITVAYGMRLKVTCSEARAGSQRDRDRDSFLTNNERDNRKERKREIYKEIGMEILDSNASFFSSFHAAWI